MIAVDTNLIVYMHRVDMPEHARALQVVAGLAEGTQPWALPWPCVHEFYSTVTSRKWQRPTAPQDAIAALRGLMASRSVRVIGEGIHHLDWLERLVRGGEVRGGAVHDARIAAICLAHGVNELWSADRDFSRFRELKTRNPLK